MAFSATQQKTVNYQFAKITSILEMVETSVHLAHFYRSQGGANKHLVLVENMCKELKFNNSQNVVVESLVHNSHNC